MKNKEFIDLYDSIILFYHSKQGNVGMQIEVAIVHGMKMENIDKPTLRYLDGRLAQSEYFDRDDDSSFGDYGAYLLNDKGHQLVEVYGSYKNYIESLTMKNWKEKYWWLIAIATYGAGLITSCLSTSLSEKTKQKNQEQSQATILQVDSLKQHSINDSIHFGK